MKMKVIWNQSANRLAHIASYIDLHAILQPCYQRILRDEVEELALPGIRERDNEQHEDAHLRHEQEKHLKEASSSARA